MVFPTYVLFTTQIAVLFRAFLSSNCFIRPRKSCPTCSESSRTQFSKSSTSDQPQRSTKASIYLKQSLDFRIIIKRSSYRRIGLSSNIIYGLFIIEISYEYQRRNVGNIDQYFNLSVISCLVSIVNKSINRTKLQFFLHSIRLYINAQTINQP